MRRTLFIMAFLLGCIGLSAQDYHMKVFNTASLLYDKDVNSIEEFRFDGTRMNIYDVDGGHHLNIRDIDSIVFRLESPHTGDTVFITYNGNSVTVDNPFSDDGVQINTNGAFVEVESWRMDVPYVVSGSSNNGRLIYYSMTPFHLTLDNLSLSNTSSAAIGMGVYVPVTLKLKGTSTLADGANGSQSGTMDMPCELTVNGPGTLQITGNAKHAMNIEGPITVNSGTIRILDSDSDGIHGSSNLTWNGGTLDIVSAGSDGLDISGNVTINNGDLTINTTAESQRGIKVSLVFTMNGGTLDITTSGTDSKGIKADSTLNINGGHLIIENSGDMSKGLKVDGEINITGGTIDLTASGSTVLENINNQNVPSYCTAIKCDTDINISNGTFHITLPTSNHGGKSISADGNLSISGGDFTITTQGDGATYTISGNNKDAYTSSCMKSEGNMEILGGTFNLTSTGRGGKGINVGGTLVIGQEGASNDDLNLNVTTSGERITITAGGGGPWGGGDYANPKGIKAQGNLTINSGNITVHCTQTQNEGGECIESKSTLTINGGNIEAYSVKDDAVNAAQNLTINGGIYYAHSDANDGTDSNGTMFINGGFNISNGSRMPEEGFDCDWNQFKITGSTSIGTGGGTSDPTQNVCTQPSLKINTQHGYAIQILKSDGTVICTYQCPTFTGGGGGGPGGGGNSMVMLFTDPQLQTGNSYTVKYGGTISGGDEWHGYYTGNVTYTGGQSVNVNVNSMYTTVSAGGGGW
ncbi:MAG: carbohydrate-binding domain-containing protein [Muribaculaceae bacterium]|nr:carbohydrate-binding domain-containing protein [Muribaculaceae bacterium]